MAKLSLCMIVKNEEDCIARCLNSVKHVVDEMIIVDTGSTDDTTQICRDLGANVLSYKWNNHFAEARNFGLQQATGDWILWLDADEEVDASDAEKLKELLETKDYDLYSIQLMNYYGKKVDPYQVIQMAHPRLFRNHIGFQFKNAIHESLNISEILASKAMQKRMTLAQIKVHHYGYLDTVVDKKKKADRNIALLKKQLRVHDQDPWLHYHMASECYRAKQYERSFQFVNQSIVLFISAGLTPPSLLYKLKYSILLSLGSVQGAYPAIEKAIALYPDYVDLHFYKGILLLFLDRCEEAIEAFEYCLELGDEQFNHLSQRGLGSFQAWYYKGLCMEKLKRQEASECYERALQLNPNHKEACMALRRLRQEN